VAYNLPDAWDPGFVLPKNVDDEGLERRALVTKQMPRGTYDQPSVGTGGYVVPRYVMDEGYGQGTFTTRWQSSGSYSGPRVPHWLNQRPQVLKTKPLPGGGKVVTVQALGDTPLPPVFENYGARAAQVLISKVAGLPAGRREAALRTIMDKVDRSLWTRTQEIFARYRRDGVAPAQAFPLALARAMSAGIAAEIIDTGLRGQAPQAKSLLGLGCYGCMAALGADDPPLLCAPPAGFVWVPTAVRASDGVTVPGHWERPRKGQPPGMAPCGAGGQPLQVTVRDNRTAHLMVGPFAFPVDIKRVWATGTPSPTVANVAAPPDLVVTDPAQVPPDWVGWLRKALTQTTDADGHTDTMRTDWLGPSASAMYGYRDADASRWFDRLGIAPGTPLRMHTIWGLRTGINPFAKLKHPTTGDNLILHVILDKRDRATPWDASSNPTVLKLYLSKVPDPSLWSSIWNTLVTLVAEIRDLAVEALDELGNLACDVLNAGGGVGGQVAGAGAAAAAGMPPQAGVAGASIAKSACGKPPPPPPPVVAPSILPMVLLAGGAVAVVALLTQKKKATTP